MDKSFITMLPATANIASSASVTIPAGKTVAILLYSSAYYYTLLIKATTPSLCIGTSITLKVHF
jgi:hypothetical protein